MRGDATTVHAGTAPGTARTVTRWVLVSLALAAVLAALVGLAFAGSPARIAAGVEIAGVDVGGLTPAEARELLERRFARVERVPVVFTAGGERFPLRATTLSVEADWAAAIETAAAGTFVGSSLMYATARDWARFGQLYLNDGTWNGERILPEGWVEFTRTPAPADSNRAYGAHFWLGVPTDPGQPAISLNAGALQAAGHEGQYVTIIPSHDAVIVRLGRTRYGDAWDHAAFIQAVLGTLSSSEKRN